MRERLYEIVQIGERGDVASRAYDVVICLISMLSTISLIFPPGQHSEHVALVITYIDITAVFILMFDYIMRWITYDIHRRRMGHPGTRKCFIAYPFTPLALIDFLALIPSLFYVPVIGEALKLLRLLKIFRLSRGLHIVMRVMIREGRTLLSVLIIMVLFVFVTALALYVNEPNTFATFVDAFYWSTAALVTVGYGDLHPKGDAGMVINIVSAVLGVAVLALPTGIIAAGYAAEAQREREAGKGTSRMLGFDFRPIATAREYLTSFASMLRGRVVRRYFATNPKVVLYLMVIGACSALCIIAELNARTSITATMLGYLCILIPAVLLEPSAGVMIAFVCTFVDSLIFGSPLYIFDAFFNAARAIVVGTMLSRVRTLRVRDVVLAIIALVAVSLLNDFAFIGSEALYDSGIVTLGVSPLADAESVEQSSLLYASFSNMGLDFYGFLLVATASVTGVVLLARWLAGPYVDALWQKLCSRARKNGAVVSYPCGVSAKAQASFRAARVYSDGNVPWARTDCENGEEPAHDMNDLSFMADPAFYKRSTPQFTVPLEEADLNHSHSPMRLRIYEIVTRSDGDDTASSAYDVLIAVTAILSILPIIFDPSSLPDNYSFAVQFVDSLTVAVLFLDYFLRWIVYDIRIEALGGHGGWRALLAYPFSPMAIIDLLAIMPTVIPMPDQFRLLRLLRLFKLFRVLRSLSLVGNVFLRESRTLLSVSVVLLLYVFAYSAAMFTIETETFNSFLQALYFGTTSLVTIGYGDYHPVTQLGEMFNSFAVLLGVAVVALPSGVIAGGYVDEMRRERAKGHTGKHRALLVGSKLSEALAGRAGGIADALSKNRVVDFVARNNRLVVYAVFIGVACVGSFAVFTLFGDALGVSDPSLQVPEEVLDQTYYVSQFLLLLFVVVPAMILEPAIGVLIGFVIAFLYAVELFNISTVMYFGIYVAWSYIYGTFGSVWRSLSFWRVVAVLVLPAVSLALLTTAIDVAIGDAEYAVVGGVHLYDAAGIVTWESFSRYFLHNLLVGSVYCVLLLALRGIVAVVVRKRFTWLAKYSGHLDEYPLAAFVWRSRL